MAVLVVGLLGGGWAARELLTEDHPTVDSAVATVPVGSTRVTRGDVAARQVVPGTLGFDASHVVVNQLADGILTRVPSAGAAIRCGQPLYWVNGRPVPLLYGSQPAWRPLQSGMGPGRDVEQLERNLRALGFDPDHSMTVDQRFTSATRAAIKRWQASLGLTRAEQTGTVQLGEALFLPEAVRVTGVLANVSTPVELGGSVLSVSSTRPVVTVQLDPGRQNQVHPGTGVIVTMPDNARTTPGTVTSVSRVATVSGADQQDAGRQDQGQAQGDAGQGEASIAVTIRLTRPDVARGLDQAPVRVTLAVDQHRHVLMVPVTALLARPGGGYAVEVASNGGRRVPIEVGLFDETTGMVEVRGAGLTEDATVEVPAT
jgi:peptidoglycan hydrolase-like protein with peptidoglycan-binding domain